MLFGFIKNGIDRLERSATQFLVNISGFHVLAQRDKPPHTAIMERRREQGYTGMVTAIDPHGRQVGDMISQ